MLKFQEKLDSTSVKQITKQKITVLQINLGKRCNLACSHCHVEASPRRTEEISVEISDRLVELIHRFPQIQTVDLTGGAPEMHQGFKQLVKAARSTNKEVIVRSNLTIYFEFGYEYLPEYFTKNHLRVIASLPCYLEDNVDTMRGKGVFNDSVRALQWLNRLGYGHSNLVLDLVYNPPLPTEKNFSLTPNQNKLEIAYKDYLKQNFGIVFNQLFTITNLPIGRSKFHLQKHNLDQTYLEFLESYFNPATISSLMCRNQVSVDYLGNIYDCDFNQMENIPAKNQKGEALTIDHLLAAGTLDLITEVQTAQYCYGCTAGTGSSCGGSLA